MTKKDFMKKTGVTKRTVNKWLKDKLIPVQYDETTGEPIIPPSARRPYFAPSNLHGNQIAVSNSILTACLQGKYFTHDTFRISKSEFGMYIRQLKESGLIEETTEDGVTYYNSTVKSRELATLSSQQRKQIIANIIKAIAKTAEVFSNLSKMSA